MSLLHWQRVDLIEAFSPARFRLYKNGLRWQTGLDQD